MFEMMRPFLQAVVLLLILFSFLAAPLNASEDAKTQTGSSMDEPIPFKRQTMPTKDYFPRVISVSLVAVGLVFGVGVCLRRKLLKKGLIIAASGLRIKVSESKRITPKMTVFLIDVDGKDYLLVQSGEQIQLAKHDVNLSAEK
jgi:flagellar biogenesis protein FliO